MLRPQSVRNIDCRVACRPWRERLYPIGQEFSGNGDNRIEATCPGLQAHHWFTSFEYDFVRFSYFIEETNDCRPGCLNRAFVA